MSGILSSSHVALSQYNFRLASMMRLRCDIPASSSCCDCGKQLDIQGYHLITCKTGGGPVITHNSIVSAWSNCLSQLNLPHKLESQYRYVNSDKRSDILIFDPDSGADIELDVSLAHAWCLDSVKAASRKEVVGNETGGEERGKVSRVLPIRHSSCFQTLWPLEQTSS